MMGLFSKLGDKAGIGEAKWHSSTKKRMQAMQDVFEQGGSHNEAMKALMRPDNFHECRGVLAISAENILPIMYKMLAGDEVDENASRFFWDEFIRHQEYCDEFFLGCEMRTYVIARAWKQKYKRMTWDSVDFCLKSGGIDIDVYRKEDWGRVACFEYLADRGHEDRTDFHSAWGSMSSDERRAVVYALGREEVEIYRLMD